MTTYKIKPLIWNKSKDEAIISSDERYVIEKHHGEYYLCLWDRGGFNTVIDIFLNKKEAVLEAKAHYKARLMDRLIPIKEKDLS